MSLQLVASFGRLFHSGMVWVKKELL